MSWIKRSVQDDPQEVQFVQEWMGNPAGSRKTLWKCHAITLRDRGVVRFVEEELPPKSKALNKPVRDKMVRVSTIK